MNTLEPMEPDEFCRGRTRQGGYCARRAGHGTDHVGVGRCRLHGGMTPNAQLSGVVELARREATIMGSPLNIDPVEGILECIRITAGEIAYCSEQIAQLQDPMETTMFGKQLDGWIIARQRAMDRMVGYSATALKANVDERRVQAAERYADSIAEAMRQFAVALGVDPGSERARAAMRQSLTLVAGGA
jgi:hypothetical protein